MKKGIMIVGALCIITVSVYAFLLFKKKEALNEITDRKGQVVQIIEANGCLQCHATKGELPFYSNVPIIGSRVKQHAAVGTKYIDLQRFVDNLKAGKEPSYVDLAKIEQSTINRSMPLMEYAIIHWTNKLTTEEQNILVDFTSAERLKIFSNELAISGLRNEFIQPLADSIPGLDARKAALGRKLYHDVRLSADNSISCATCHDLATAGCDQIQFSKGIHGQYGGINAPTVYNAMYNIAQFWDGRLPDLQAQAGGPPFDALEMGSKDWAEICTKLNADAAFVKEFKTVYSDGFTGETVTHAIAEFEKTLITPNSRFDLFLKGDPSALTDAEVNGYSDFKNNNCATCHAGPAMGGLSFEYFGIARDYLAERPMKADREIIRIKDQGHYNLTNDSIDLQRYKVPTLRNIALTPPYMHDGTATSLDEAVVAMFRYQLNKEADKKTVQSIVSFLGSLNGQYQGKELQ